MTRDDIYDHLAKVYLGKKSQSNEGQKKKQLSAWLILNVVITIVIFATSIYGLTAFLKRRDDLLRNRIIFALNKGPIRLQYNLSDPYPPVKSFSLAVPVMNAGKYTRLQFAVRGLEEGYPGIMRIEIKNSKNETASVFIDHVRLGWKKFEIPFERFDKISDWSDIQEISFIMEAWNTDKKKGIILIDDICFSG